MRVHSFATVVSLLSVACSSRASDSGIATKALPLDVAATGAAPKAPVTTGDELRQDAKAERAFAAKLYGALREGDGNLFFSPASVRLALAMTYVGARGATATEMATALGFGTAPHSSDLAAAQLRTWASEASASGLAGEGAEAPATLPDAAPPADPNTVVLRIANRLWGQTGKSFQPDFVRTLASSYRAPFTPLDFANSPEPSRLAINTWVEKATEQKIKELLPAGSVNSATTLALTNAVYFKASWSEPFAANATHEGDFAGAPAGHTRATFMERVGSYNYGETTGAKVVELPYGTGQWSMVVVLPNDPAGVRRVEAAITPDSFEHWTDSLARRQVRVTFPKFKTTGAFELTRHLAALGMPRAFDPHQADFSGIDGTHDLSISAVIHKAYVDVDEKGTEAAAATAIVMKSGAAMSANDVKEFRADRPFLFFIRDTKSGQVLFVGRVVDPKG